MSACGFNEFTSRKLTFGVPQGQSIRPLVRINGMVDEIPSGYRIPPDSLGPFILSLADNVLSLIVGTGECSSSTSVSLPNWITCEQVGACMVGQSVNGVANVWQSVGPVPHFFLQFQGYGPNDLRIQYDHQAFCGAVRSCVPQQTVNNTTAPQSFAGFTLTGDNLNNIRFEFNQEIFCQTVRSCITLPSISDQTINNGTSAFSSAGFTFTPTGQNNINISFDQLNFCQAVQSCITVQNQTINNTTTPVSFAGFTFAPTGQNNINISFDLAQLCQTIAPCLPPVTLQNVTGNLPSWLNATGAGDDVIAFNFDPVGFCQAVQACASFSETPITPQNTATATVTVGGPANHTIQVNVNIAPGINAIQVSSGGLIVNNCTVGNTIDQVPTTPPGSRIVVLDNNNCLRAVVPQTLELRDCSNNLIATYLVLPA